MINSLSHEQDIIIVLLKPSEKIQQLNQPKTTKFKGTTHLTTLKLSTM